MGCVVQKDSMQTGIKKAKKNYLNKSMSMKNQTENSEIKPSTSGKIVSAPDHQENLSNSDEPLKTSKKVWQQPKNARELAEQANLVATMILNDDITIEKAAKYVSAARTTAQMLSLEVAKARLNKEAINLNFKTEETEV